MQLPNRLTWLTLCVFAAMIGCGGGEDDPVVMVDADDPEMLAATKKALDSIDQFTTALANHSPDQTDFAVKMEFKQGERSEYMWLTDLEFADGTFTGTLNNEPGMVTNAELGQRYSVAASEVNDWLYMDGGELVGGHTIVVLMARESD